MAFASHDDVAARLKRDLTEAETTSADAVLDIVDGLIRDELGKSADWDPDPVPPALQELSIQKAVIALANPENFASFSEQLGAFQRSGTFQRIQDGGIFLSDAEGRMARLSVYGTNTGSAPARGPFDRMIDNAEFRDIDSDPDVS